MKKRIVTALCLMLFILLTSCRKESISESSGSSKSNRVIKWFDCLNGDEMVWDGVKEYTLEKFPGVTFRWYPERLEAVTGTEVRLLYSGMPIWSVYFCDLTGDGNPELCSTLSMGSGIIDNRIAIYDYAGGVSYDLSDRGNFDYVLNMQDDSLMVEKRVYMGDELVESGELAFITGIVKEAGENFILIENEDGEYVVSLTVENEDSMNHFSIGDEVVVYYDGNIAESYPMQINTAYAITLKTPAAN